MAEDQILAAAILWLVRHGQTEWNLEGRYQGQADPPLNPRGLEEAAGAANFLAGRSIAALYSSDLLRARQTAEVIACQAGLSIRLDRRLREVALGEWEGRLFGEIKVRYPREIQLRELHPLHFRPPGGETLAELWQRTRTALVEISRSHPGKEVVVVSHGLTIAAVITGVEGKLDQALTMTVPNAQPMRLEWSLNGAAHPLEGENMQDRRRE